MAVIRHAGPAQFFDAAAPVLARDEAEGILLETRIATLLRRRPEPGSSLYLATVDGGSVHGAAVQVGDYPLSIGASEPAAAVAFAEDLASEQLHLVGVHGLIAPGERFAERWHELTGRVPALRFRFRHHGLFTVNAVPKPAGAARRATPEDIPWLVDAMEAFLAETGMPTHGPGMASRFERGIAHGFHWVWEHCAPVAFASWYPAIRPAARIAPVYTLPEQRGNGYATALVASMCRWLLEDGATSVWLTTDIGNPVSNAIYARIGFHPTSDAMQFDLGGAAGPGQ